jgi:hypothetical protein
MRCGPTFYLLRAIRTKEEFTMTLYTRKRSGKGTSGRENYSERDPAVMFVLRCGNFHVSRIRETWK